MRRDWLCWRAPVIPPTDTLRVLCILLQSPAAPAARTGRLTTCEEFSPRSRHARAAAFDQLGVRNVVVVAGLQGQGRAVGDAREVFWS
jgi:hypothetical protein